MRLVRCLVLGAAGVLLLSLAGVRWGGGDAASAPAVPQRALVVAARAIAAGSVVASADVEVRSVVAADALPGTLPAAAAVDGRRLLVSVSAGVPLLVSMLDPPGPRPGRRTVVVVTDADHLDSALAPGADTDVIAAVDGDNHAGAVVPVAVARVVAVTPLGAAPPGTSGDRGSAASVAVTLECDDAVALRIIWAESYAHAIRLLVSDGGAGPPPAPVDGLPR